MPVRKLNVRGLIGHFHNAIIAKVLKDIHALASGSHLTKPAFLICEYFWVTIATTTAVTYVHEGLESAHYYFFRMAIVIPEGTNDFCEPVKKLVL